MADLTGPGTSSFAFGVGGTDLGIPVRQPDGRIAYLFGDTFEMPGVGGPGWRSPVLLRSEPGLREDRGIQFTSAASGAYDLAADRRDHGRRPHVPARHGQPGARPSALDGDRHFRR
jgi:hypothetical protein